MYRLCSTLAVLAIVSSFTIGRNVHTPHKYSSETSKEGGYNLGKNVSGADSSEVTKSEENTTAAVNISNGDKTDNGTVITANGDDDNGTTTATTVSELSNSTTKAPFRNARSIDTVKESAEEKSASDECKGSGEKDKVDQDVHIISSREDLLPVSAINGTSSKKNSSTTTADLYNEVGSGGEEPAEVSSNEVPVPDTAVVEKIAVLKKKVQHWQSTVDNYLQGGTRRRRRQSSWSHLFPSSGTLSNIFSSPNTAAKGSNSAMPGVSNSATRVQ